MVAVTAICMALGVGTWLGARAAVAIAGPSLAVGLASFTRRRDSDAPDAAILFLFGVAAAFAVLGLYDVRHEFYHGYARTVAWYSAVVLYGVAPLAAGILRSKPSPFATCVAALLCLTPAAHHQLDRFDFVPETIFLLMASSVTYVSAGWTAHFVRSRFWIGIIGALLWLVAGCLWVLVEAWVILFFE
jgi:hypothetical protein